ncbi:MAG: tripartite tricarboxylate transporter substrate binding protein [Pseudomonadota bacterium]
MINLLRKAALAMSALAASLMPLAAMAQGTGAYPDKPLRFVVPAPAGGPTDLIARMIAERLTLSLKQTVTVDNRPGASQILGTSFVAKADADGYTLLFTPSTPIVMVPNTLKNVPYDVQRDLAGVAHIGATPLVVYANTTRPVTDLRSLLAFAKANPDKASYGTSGVGSSTHLLPEMLVKRSGVPMVHVPYKGVSPNLQDLAKGEVLISVADVGSAIPLVQAGKIRPIAVTGSKRSRALPDVPTFAEQGYSGMEPFSPWFAVFAPKRTPKPIVDLLASHITRIVKEPDFTAKLLAFGVDATGLAPEGTDEFARDDMARWKRIVQELPDIKYE